MTYIAIKIVDVRIPIIDWSAANMVILITLTIGIKVLFEPILLYTDNLYTDTTNIGTSYSYMIDDSCIIINLLLVVLCMVGN